MKQKMGGKEFKSAFTILLIPIFFITHNYLESFSAITFYDFLKILFIHCLFALVFFLVLLWLIKSIQKAAICFFLIGAFYYLYGSIHDLLREIFANGFATRYSFILPAITILLFILIRFFRKTQINFHRLAAYLNILFLLLTVVDFIQISIKSINEENRKEQLLNIHVKNTTNFKPDIYLIIADEYAGPLQLKQLFNFDNSAFEDSLKAKGFHIVNNSRSNYNFTLNSMASILNMSYLKPMDKAFEKENITNCLSIINHNYFSYYLAKQGYKIKNLSLFRLNDIPPITENIFPLGPNRITHQTFLSRLIRDIGYHLVTTFKIKFFIKKIYESHYTNLRNNGLVSKELLQESEKNIQFPKFVYAHLLMPHDPYYFDKNGHEFTEYEEKGVASKDRYIGYLQYSNKHYLYLLKKIIDNAKRPTVVLFMSDHGSRFVFTSPQEIKFQYSTINAVYFSDKNYKQFPDGISHVNELRILLNTIFNEDLPLLKDKYGYLSE